MTRKERQFWLYNLRLVEEQLETLVADLGWLIHWIRLKRRLHAYCKR